MAVLHSNKQLFYPKTTGKNHSLCNKNNLKNAPGTDGSQVWCCKPLYSVNHANTTSLPNCRLCQIDQYKGIPCCRFSNLTKRRSKLNTQVIKPQSKRLQKALTQEEVSHIYLSYGPHNLEITWIPEVLYLGILHITDRGL